MNFLKKKHFLGFWTYFLLLDLDGLLKKRDADLNAFNCNYCVYTWKKNGIIHYIGQGYFKVSSWETGRPFVHTDDLLSKTIDSSWTCEIISWGLTQKEARIIESFLINLSKRKLAKTGVSTWDGESLINKRREVNYNKEISFEQLFHKYLNLDNGNNYWEAFRRQINGD